MSNFLAIFLFFSLALGNQAKIQITKPPSPSELSGVWHRIESTNQIESAFANCIIHSYVNATDVFVRETILEHFLIGQKIIQNFYYRKGNDFVTEGNHGLRIKLVWQVTHNKKFMCQKKTATSGYVENAILSRTPLFKPKELERAKKELAKICTEKMYPIDQDGCSKTNEGPGRDQP